MLIALLVGIFFYPTILQGKLPVPTDTLVGLYHPWRDVYAEEYPRGVPFKNFLITDPVRQQIPWRKIAIDQWKEGEIPWWNPYSFSGTPLAANIQAAVFYPLNILFFLFDFKIAWTILIILQPILAGLFFYWFARSKNLSDAASLFGAIAWSFSGFMISWMTWGTIGHVALWLPLILLAIDRKNYWLFTFALSIQFFAGHAQISLYLIIFSLLYAWYNKKISKGLLLSLFLAGMTTAIQWIPFVQLFQHASRAVDAGVTKPGWLMPWYHLVQFFAPDFFGNPATGNYWGEWNYGEFIGYIGVIPLLFALRGVFVKEAKFWKLLLLASLVLLVSHPLTVFVYGLGLPVISTLQPTRLMVITVFSLVMLSFYGFEVWRGATKNNMRPPVVLGIVYGVLWLLVLFGTDKHFLVSRNNLVLPTGMFFAGLLFYFIKNKKIALIGILCFTVFDLFRFGWKFTPFTPPEYFFPETKIISYLQSQPKPFRVMVVDDRILPPNVSAYYGIETINGYDPLIFAPYEGLMTSVENRSDFNRIIVAKNIDSPVIAQLNITYVLSLDEIRSPLVEKVMDEGQTKLYKFIPGLSRVYFEPNNPLEPTVAEYSDDRITIKYSSDQRRTLIISQIFYPGWHATIDNTQVPVHRANDLFIGIEAPEGQHTVRLSYN